LMFAKLITRAIYYAHVYTSISVRMKYEKAETAEPQSVAKTYREGQPGLKTALARVAVPRSGQSLKWLRLFCGAGFKKRAN